MRHVGRVSARVRSGAKEVVEGLDSVASNDQFVEDVVLLEGAPGEELVVRVVLDEEDSVLSLMRQIMLLPAMDRAAV